MDRLERAAFIGAKALSVVGLGGLCLLAVMTLADGLGRWLFNTSIEGVRDMGGLVIAVAVASCLPMGLIERGHIGVRLWASLGPRWGRAMDTLASVVVLGVMMAMAWQLQSYADKLARARETTWVLQIPAAPFWWVVALILWAAVAVQAVVVLTDFARPAGAVRHAPHHS
nr:TRAP transporter small permease subunit [Ramlibacter aurantiacus]